MRKLESVRGCNPRLFGGWRFESSCTDKIYLLKINSNISTLDEGKSAKNDSLQSC